MADITPNAVVTPPQQLFTMPNSFKAVFNGYVYIGIIDSDPTIPANQIQVYVENESGQYVEVPQPLRTNAGGYLVYNGQVSKFVTVKGFSMTVQDSLGAQLYHYPNVLKYDPDQLKALLTGHILDEDGYPYGDLARTPEGFGAIGDGVTDDTPAMQAAFTWVSSGSGRRLFSGNGTLYRITSTVTADFNATATNCSIIFTTPVFADTDTGVCFKVLDTLNSEFKFSFKNGGVYSGAQPAYGTSTMPVGAQIGLFIQACRQCGFEVQAENYRGRVIHVTERNSDGVTGQTWKTSALMFRRISTGTATSAPCGQSIWADGRSGDMSNFGEVVTWYSLWDQYGPVFNKVLDLTVHHMEAGWQANNGLVFRGCGSLHLIAINLGDESAGTVEQMRFQAADDGATCDTVHIVSMHVGSSYRAIHVAAGAFSQGESSSWINIDTSNTRDAALFLEGWGMGKITHYSRDDNQSMRIANSTYGFDVELHCVSARSVPVTISSTVSRIRFIGGGIINPAGTASGALVQISTGSSGFVFMGMHFRISAVNSAIFSATSTLYRVIGCSFDMTDNPTAPIFAGNIIPKVTNNGGFISANHGAAVIPAGSTSITVNHGLALTPSSVNVTAGANATTQVRATTLGATTFTVTIASAPGSDATVYWTAEI